MLVKNSGPHIIERLEDELDLARQRIQDLERALGIGDDLMPLRLMGLSPQEAKFVNALHKRKTLTKAQAMLAIYDRDDDRRFDVVPKIMDVVACRARHRLKCFGISFEQYRGEENDGGYRMSGPDKSRLAKLMASGARSGAPMRVGRGKVRLPPRARKALGKAYC